MLFNKPFSCGLGLMPPLLGFLTYLREKPTKLLFLVTDKWLNDINRDAPLLMSDSEEEFNNGQA